MGGGGMAYAETVPHAGVKGARDEMPSRRRVATLPLFGLPGSLERHKSTVWAFCVNLM